jgi:hypothetical protein
MIAECAYRLIKEAGNGVEWRYCSRRWRRATRR